MTPFFKFHLPPSIEKSSKCFLTYPPKIFPVGVLGNRVIGIDFTYEGSKPGSLRYVLLTHHSSDLKRLNMNSLRKPKGVNLVISVNWIVNQWPSKTSMRPPQFILLHYRDAMGLSTLSGHWNSPGDCLLVPVALASLLFMLEDQEISILF